MATQHSQEWLVPRKSLARGGRLIRESFSSIMGRLAGDLEIHDQLELVFDLEEADGYDGGEGFFHSGVIFFAEGHALFVELHDLLGQLVGFGVGHGGEIVGVVGDDGQLYRR